MTSTTKRLLPVTAIDDTIIGDGKAGPVTTSLNRDFINMGTNYLLQRGS